jgi:hypothetical protein
MKLIAGIAAMLPITDRSILTPKYEIYYWQYKALQHIRQVLIYSLGGIKVAVIDTSISGWLDTIPDLVRSLRAKLIEELDATTSYEKLIFAIRAMGYALVGPDGKTREIPEDKLDIVEANKVADIIQEIRDDEIEHTGRLIDLLSKLDDTSSAAFKISTGI